MCEVRKIIPGETISCCLGLVFRSRPPKLHINILGEVFYHSIIAGGYHIFTPALQHMRTYEMKNQTLASLGPKGLLWKHRCSEVPLRAPLFQNCSRTPASRKVKGSSLEGGTLLRLWVATCKHAHVNSSVAPATPESHIGISVHHLSACPRCCRTTDASKKGSLKGILGALQEVL